MSSEPARPARSHSSARGVVWTLGRLASFAIVALCIGWMCEKSAQEAMGHPADLTLDDYSEACYVRSADRFLDEGFWKHKGIPDVAYGELFAKIGAKYDKKEACPEPHDCFYTHNPPGAIYLVTLFAAISGGPSKLLAVRLFGVVFGLLCFVAFFREIMKHWGGWRAAVIALVLTQIPMSYNHLHGFAYHGYVQSLLLLEMALLLHLFFTPGRAKNWVWVALFTITFVQGWMAYDYVFLLSLAPVCLWLFRADFRERDVVRKMVLATVIAAGGFGIAQILHLVQNAMFFGSWQAAWDDLVHAGRKRTVGEGSAYRPTFALPHPFGVWFTYWFRHVNAPPYFDGMFFAWFGGIFAILVSVKRRVLWHGANRVFGFAKSRRVSVALVIALFACAGWGTMLPQHAFVHTHFVPRQYYFAVLIALMALLHKIRIGRRFRPPPAA